MKARFAEPLGHGSALSPLDDADICQDTSLASLGAVTVPAARQQAEPPGFARWLLPLQLAEPLYTSRSFPFLPWRGWEVSKMRPTAATQRWHPCAGLAALSLPARTSRPRRRPAANSAEGSSLRPFLGKARRRKTLQGHEAAQGETGDTARLPPRSLFCGGSSSDPAWHPGVLPMLLAPSTEHGPPPLP